MRAYMWIHFEAKFLGGRFSLRDVEMQCRDEKAHKQQVSMREHVCIMGMMMMKLKHRKLWTCPPVCIIQQEKGIEKVKVLSHNFE